jgi:hypothetical protein
MTLPLRRFFLGENIQLLLDCDDAFSEHCQRVSYDAHPSQDPLLVSKAMGRALLEIAVAFAEKAHPSRPNLSLFEAACVVYAVVCDRDQSDVQGVGGHSLTLKRLLGSRGGMPLAQTVTRVLQKHDLQMETELSKEWRTFIQRYCRILWSESAPRATHAERETAIAGVLRQLFEEPGPDNGRIGSPIPLTPAPSPHA